MKDIINTKKLFFEGTIALSLILMSTIIITTNAISAYSPAGKDKYYNYREIVDQVDEYDYSKGRDEEFEKMLDNKFATTEGNRQFYYGLARAIYYCNVGFYNTASSTFYEIQFIAPDEAEYNAMRVRSVLCDRENGR